jgi:hypothetical protein
MHEGRRLRTEQHAVHPNLRRGIGTADRHLPTGDPVDFGLHPERWIAGEGDMRVTARSDANRTRAERKLLIVELEDGHGRGEARSDFGADDAVGLSTRAPGTR